MGACRVYAKKKSSVVLKLGCGQYNFDMGLAFKFERFGRGKGREWKVQLSIQVHKACTLYFIAVLLSNFCVLLFFLITPLMG